MSDASSDWEAVYDVLVRYAIALDQHDWPGVEGCFEPSASFQYPGGECADAASIVDRATRALTPLTASQHLLGTIRIDLQGDIATTSTYFQAQHVKQGTPGGDTFIIAGTYEDTLRRTGADWRIIHRTQSYAWTDGNPAVVGRTPSPD